MGGAHVQHLGETKFVEIGGQRLVHLLVNLVDDQDQRQPPRAQHGGQFPVQGGEARPPIHHEEEDVGACDRGLRRGVRRLRKVGIR